MYKQLEEKHKGSYTPEQMCAWAHMIQLGEHSSYGTPPDKPFFVVNLLKIKLHLFRLLRNPPFLHRTPFLLEGVSLRNECIEQLQKWHTLLESGVITSRNHRDRH